MGLTDVIDRQAEEIERLRRTIKQLQEHMQVMSSWASEVSDEFIDGGECRQEYVADLERARELCRSDTA